MSVSGVQIIGTGLTRFAKYPAIPLPEIAYPAVLEALREAGVERAQVQAVWCGSALSGMMVGQRILANIGMTGVPITNVENACSSSAVALRSAAQAIEAGACDLALVLGAEKLTRFGGGTIPLNDEDPEVRQGMTMPALYALRARRYMHEYGLTARDLASVAVKARRHGAANPLAQLQGGVSLDEVLGSRPIADPLTLFQCCPTGDGAAALIVASTARAQRLGVSGIKVRGSELNSGVWTSGFRDMTAPEITVRGAAEIYEATGFGPGDIDVAEVHDAFTIAELLYYEAFGFCARGEAASLLHDGATSIGGRIPVNPSGGLLSKGHPVGATGAAQIVEIVRQLQGRAGARQVENARIGLTHATGGGIAGFDHGACSIHILER